MEAVILAGGKGTRLRPFTMTIPKPLLPLGDVPVLEIVLHQLKAAGFKRVVLALNHMAPVFSALMGNGNRFGLHLETVIEDEPLGTAGALRLISKPKDDILVMNGDVLTNLDYRELVDHHKKRRAAATIAVNRRSVLVDYGVVVSDRKSELRKYREKPTVKYCVSMGIYVFSPEALCAVPHSGKYDVPQLVLALKGAGQRVFCYKTDCYWQDIGRFEDYEAASSDFVKDPNRFLPRSA